MMEQQVSEKKRSVTSGILNMKCPQCREGELFEKPGLFVVDGLGKMHTNCPVCGLKYEQEPGFWWGAMYVSYGLAVFTALPIFVMFYKLVGLSFWGAFFAMGFVQLILAPPIFRLSRSIWIYLLGNYQRS